MKVPALLLACSLLANVVLFVVLSFQPSDQDVSSGPGPDSATSLTSKPNQEAAAAEAKRNDEKVWAVAATGDFANMVSRLRAAGFPEHVIRVVLRVQLDEHFNRRRKELIGDAQEAPFWQTGSAFYADSADPKIRATLRAMHREHTRIVKELLGPDGQHLTDSAIAEMRSHHQRRYGDLPPEKIDQLEKITSDYSELRQEIYSASRDILLPEDREKIAFLEKEQRADLAKILTPQELEEYDLRSSPTASQLRNRLAVFKPTEEEFRAIFKLQRAMDEQLGSTYAMSAEQAQQRRAQQKEVDAQVQSLLTPERYNQYKLVSDPAYMALGRVVARFNLPAQAAHDVVALQADVSQRAQAIYNNQQLSAEQREAQISALAQEANAKAARALGPRAVEAYKEYGGQWLQNIRRPAPRATPPGAPPAPTTTVTVPKS